MEITRRNFLRLSAFFSVLGVSLPKAFLENLSKKTDEKILLTDPHETFKARTYGDLWKGDLVVIDDNGLARAYKGESDLPLGWVTNVCSKNEVCVTPRF